MAESSGTNLLDEFKSIIMDLPANPIVDELQNIHDNVRTAFAGFASIVNERDAEIAKLRGLIRDAVDLLRIPDLQWGDSEYRRFNALRAAMQAMGVK